MTIATTKTVGEIAAETPSATREFEKLGIDYCCGGSRTLGEACAEANISIDEAMARLQKSIAATQPGDQDWQNQLLADLIAHITSTHHVFVREECPRIEALAAKVVGVHGRNHPELLQVQEIFCALAEELSVHLMKEEQILFPYVHAHGREHAGRRARAPSDVRNSDEPCAHDDAGARRRRRCTSLAARSHQRLHASRRCVYQLSHAVPGLAGF